MLATTGFVGGPQVAAFEREYAAFGGVEHCVGVANGTDAVELALRAVGVGPGDEVIVPANTFVATAGAVARIGAKPMFVDCDPDSCLIDVRAALAAIRPATKAIVPVHLYGQMAPVEELQAGLAGSDVRIVEDAAQCQGAKRRGRTPGSGPGAIAATSFYPGKNLGAYGDGGAVLTDDEDLARTVRMLGSHGGLVKYAHDIAGVNSRLDALQAVVLRAKLRRLPEWNAARQAAAAYYDKLLAGLDGVTLPTVLAGQRARLAPLHGPGPRARRGPGRPGKRGHRSGDPLPGASPPDRRVRHRRVVSARRTCRGAHALPAAAPASDAGAAGDRRRRPGPGAVCTPGPSLVGRRALRTRSTERCRTAGFTQD